MPDSATVVARTCSIATKPANAFGQYDSERLPLRALREVTPADLAGRLAISADAATLAVKAGRARSAAASNQMLRRRDDLLGELLVVHGQTFDRDEAPLHILDVAVEPAVLSDKPFELIIRYSNDGDAPVALASVAVQWQGEPFLIEQAVRGKSGDGSLTVTFDAEHTLPVGLASFDITLYRADGAQSTFVRSCYVLPSNPLSLALSPAGARVTGTWSARGDYLPASDTFLTECEITIANGDGSAVGMNRRVTWQFWDGGVGSGTVIESGAFDWPNAISVSAYGVWRGSAWFSSPRGSGIFGVYDRKEDMAISVSMTASDGRRIEGQITARVMLAFGVNIIKVGAFEAQEHVDLYDAVDQVRQIYERRDLTFRGVDRRIIDNAQAGGYTVLDSEDETRDMWEDWSCRNDFVDVYVVQDFNWGGYNGYAGDIPGPASKGGRKDGVAVEKTGYTDGSGTLRLSVTTLSQLIGHEVGHYIGLPHLENTNNLMRSNTGVRGPDLDYNQYRLMFPHGYVFYE